MNKKSKINEPVIETTEETTETGTGEVSLESRIEKQTEAIQELTKIIGDLVKENVKWYRAGKMALPYVFTTCAMYGMLLT